MSIFIPFFSFTTSIMAFSAGIWRVIEAATPASELLGMESHRLSNRVVVRHASKRN
jgi:hypothetical protein